SISYQTSSLPAEAPVGGIQVNMIPRDGGNQYKGAIFATGANGSLQSNNNSADLEALGFKKQNRVKSVYDVNFTVGGPVLKNKLWFCCSARCRSATNYVGNTFTSTGDQAIDDGRLGDLTARVTAQASKNNKLSLPYRRHIN